MRLADIGAMTARVLAGVIAGYVAGLLLVIAAVALGASVAGASERAAAAAVVSRSAVMDAGNIAQWGSFAVALMALAISLLNGRRGEIVMRIVALDVAVDKLDSRLTTVERDLQHLPDKDAAHRLEMAIARLEGRLESVDERLKPLAAMASRMQDYLMDGARK